MILKDAQEILASILAPITYDAFLDEFMSRKPMALLGQRNDKRSRIAGDDPKAAILAGFAKYAPTLTCHIRNAKTAPPSAREVESAAAFYDLIREYHERDYTVRIPNVTHLSPELDRLTRAIELIVANPVGVVAFWSANHAEAPVHHDEVDVIVIQLAGTKKWFISDAAPTLPNKWKSLGETQPPLGPNRTYDVAPGDLLYLPRGTPHTVQSTGESLHLSIGFVPVTAREAIAAAIDYLSDLDISLRANLGKRADSHTRNVDAPTILEQIRTCVAKLHHYCNSDIFIRDALAHRHSTMLYELPKLSRAPGQPAVGIDTRVRHHPLAMARLNVTAKNLDFRQPGEQLVIHPSVEWQMRFIADTPAFKVADIPGNIGDDIRLALVNRLIASGFLEVDT